MIFPTSDRDADAQLARAREAALAWLRATLASLPAAVTSLSVGVVPEDSSAHPVIIPELRATMETPTSTLHYPDDYPDEGTLECIDALNDGLADMTEPFLFALRAGEWLTVTRADVDAMTKAAGIDPFVHMGRDVTPRRWIASKNAAPKVGFHDVQLIPAADGLVLAAIMQGIVDLPRGEATTLRIRRGANGALTWAVTEP